MRPIRVIMIAAVMITVGFSLTPTLRAQTAQDTNLKRIFLPYWTIADGYQSTIQLHNNLVNGPVKVHPVILTPDGQRAELADVRLEALENLSLNIGDALSRAGYRNLEWGSAILEYSRRYGGALGAEISVIQTARTLAYTITGNEQGASGADLAAVFWLPSRNAEVYVALQNTADVQITVNASLQTSAGSTLFRSVKLGPLQTQVLPVPVDSLWRGLSQTPSRYGGIILSLQGPEGALNTSGWIEDDRTGYSSMMTFHDPKRHHGNTLYGTQILLGQQANLLASGRPLAIDSYLELFNTSASESVVPTAHFVYERDGQVRQVPLILATIKPREVVQVDLGDLRKDGSVPQSVSGGSIIVDYAGPQGALMGRVFGIANDPSFGFYWALESYAASAMNEIYWTTSDDAVSLLTIGNFAAKADEIAVIVTYNGGSVSLPKISLQPYQSMSLNMRNLVERDILPATAEYGGFRIFGTPGISKIVVKEHVISERLRIATPFYGGPPYAQYEYLSKSSPGTECEVSCSSPQYDLQLDQTGSVWPWVHWSDNTEHAPASIYSIWSNDTSKATVSSDTPGTITAVSPGTTTISSQSWELIDSSADYGLLASVYPAQVISGCGDDRGNIVKEYVTRSVDFVPGCTDFVTSANTTYFGTTEYNYSGYHSSFIARSTLESGADGTRSSYGSALTVSGGYRCPDKEYDIDTAASVSFTYNSRHMHGDAMDWASNSGTWTNIHDAAKTNSACVEPSIQSSYNHVHADWRGSCPTGW